MSTILVVESNHAGSGTMALRIAKAWGYRTHFLCRSPAEYEARAVNPMAVADEVTVVDTFDIARLIRVVDGRDDYVAVLAYDDLCVLQAALLGQYLGLAHSPPPSAITRTRFKDRFRAALAGTPWSVRHATVELTVASSPVGYPCVVKPTDVAGNYGVSVCRDEREFLAALTRLRDFTGRVYGRGYQPMPVALVEEELAGEEFSAEMVWSTRLVDWRLIGFTTKEFSGDSCPIEVEHMFPHEFTTPVNEHVTAQLRGCLRALGLRDTLVHVEFRLHDGVISLIEVNCRPAGGKINDLVEMALGSSLIELHVAAHLGLVDAILDDVKQRQYAGIRFLLPTQEGIIERFSVESIDEPNVDIHTVPTPLRTDAVFTSDSRIAHVIASGRDEDEVHHLLNKNLSRVQPHYRGAL